MNAPAEIVEAPARLFNRELSWLTFNRRVLEEATNSAHPLLERLRFLSISGTNLDEFYMVRVAGLKGHQLQGVDDLSADGMTATQQLAAIAEEADALVVAQQAEWLVLREALAEAQLEVVLEEGLKPYLADNTEAWEMDCDGRYKRRAARGPKACSAQRLLLERLADRVE